MVDAIICLVKQFISRIDDHLHRRLKERAAQEGALNNLVAEVLANAVDDGQESFRRRLERSGLRVLPSVTQRPPSMDDVLDAYPTYPLLPHRFVSDEMKLTQAALRGSRRPAR